MSAFVLGSISLSMTEGYAGITPSILYPIPASLKHILLACQRSLSVKKIQFYWGDSPIMKIPVKPTESFILVSITL